MATTLQLHQPASANLAVMQWWDDPHCIALVERIAETLMQIDDDVIESSDDAWTQLR